MRTCIIAVIWSVLSVVFAVLCSIGYAADVQQISNECRAVLEANFQAMSEENIKALMATTSSKTATPAQMAEFRREAEQMFKDTDLYVRIDKFELYRVQPPYAYAYVNQLTLPKNESDHYPREQGKLNFRHHSALLPEHQLVQYQQKFHFENGQWKLHRVLSRPQPVDSWSARELNDGDVSDVRVSRGMTVNMSQQQQCPDGKCNSQFIKVRR